MSSRALSRRLANLESQIQPEKPQIVIVVSYVDNNRQVVGTQRFHIGGGPDEPYTPVNPERQENDGEACE